MKDLRRRFERFCLKNRGKGIPNLMLVIAIGNLAVFALSYIDPSNIVYSYLCFSRSAILRGQVWRLFSYIFTYLNDVRGAGLLLAAVSLFCYYQFGKILESYKLFDIYDFPCFHIYAIKDFIFDFVQIHSYFPLFLLIYSCLLVFLLARNVYA